MPDDFLHGVEVLEIDTGPRPIRTARTGVIGIVGTAPEADAEAFPVNEPVLIYGSRGAASKLGATGTLPVALEGILDQIGALVVVVRVEAGADEAATLAAVVGGAEAGTGALTGVHALVGSKVQTGVEPKILIAPGWTHQRPEDPQNAGAVLANPVVAEMKGLLSRLGAIVVADGPNTTDADALAAAVECGNDAVYLVDPWLRVYDADGEIAAEPPSARVAGLIARIDNESGFWVSPSNREIFGVIGLTRSIDFRMGDRNSRANVLNAGNVSTFIRESGIRLWGNRGTGADPKYSFLQTRRIANAVADALQASHLWAVDRNLGRTFFEEVAEGVNAYLGRLTAKGAILGGRCWPDPDLNDAAAITDGRSYFNVELTGTTPAELISFRLKLVDDYAEEVV